ncbi:glycosyltransferase [Methylomusa anaerophila]
MHDGIRTASYIPKPDAKLVLPEIGLDLSAAKEIVTYVGRGMEPYRGFPQFMEAMDLLLRRRPRTHVVIVGADRMAYGGKKAPDGKTYKEWMLEKLALDLSRVHFTGLLPRYQYLQVLQASSVHVYLTYPFVLSWSMLEAMSAGCLLVASDTPPVREVIEDGQNGLLVDFFSPGQIADKVGEALDHPQDMKKIRARARETIVERYDFNKLLPRQLAFLQQMAESEYR